MKQFIALFLLFFLFFSCSTLKKEDYSIKEEKRIKIEKIDKKISKAFMTKKAIKQEFTRLTNAKEMDERLDKAALERIKNSFSDKLFIAPDHLKELYNDIKKRKSQKSIKLQKTSNKTVDRSNCDNKAISQCGGTCTSHGITNAMDNLLCKPKKQDGSNQHLWSKYKQYSTWTGVRTAAKTKICESKYWPNCGSKKSGCNSNSHIGIKSWKYLGNDIEAIKKALDNGHPLVYSGKVTRSWANCDAVVNPKSSATGGGHAVAIVGYTEDPEIIGGGYVKILNSWGNDCGDKGYQYLPFYYFQRTSGGMYAFAHEIKEIYSKYNDGTIEPVDPVNPEPKPDCKKVRECTPLQRCKWAFWKKCKYCGPWKTVCK